MQKERILKHEKYLNIQKVAFPILKYLMFKKWIILIREKRICVVLEDNRECLSFWQKSLTGKWCGLRLLYKDNVLDKAYLIAGDEEEEVFTNIKTTEVFLDEKYLLNKEEIHKMGRDKNFFESISF